MSFGPLPTPFHSRTAERNRDNVWLYRGRHMLAAHYGNAHREALAASVTGILADVSAIEDLRVEGSGAVDLLARACGPGLRGLPAGRLCSVSWSADGDGLRGAGTLMRQSANAFLLRSADADFGWFAQPAPRFGASVADATTERGLLLLAGSCAGAVLCAAGLGAAMTLEHDEHRRLDWDGVPVWLCREPRLNAYLIAAASEDSVLIFDRLLRAGHPFGLRLAGQEAVEILQLEAGIVLPHIDFEPARANAAKEPLAVSLGLAAGSAARILVGVQFDSDDMHPFAPLFDGRKEVGRTLRSAYSLSLRRGIALAQIEPAYAAPGTKLNLESGRDPPPETVARVVTLPFL